MRKSLAVVLSLTLPTLLLAHPGHSHHVMGTVSEVAAGRLGIQDLSGATVYVGLLAETQYLRDKTLVAAPSFKAGDRIMVDAREVSGKMVAVKVWLGKPGAKQQPM
jgi:hydrogenase/urease accessory protein HupE